MRIEARTVSEYVKQVPQERKRTFNKLRKTIKDNLPKGFVEIINYGMIGYVVPHSLYPDGYHCNSDLPLPFAGLASQKNFIGFYHMGIYADKKLYTWFTKEYAKRVSHKLDMGKSCIRLKKLDDIPYDLIAELMQKTTVADWIARYEKSLKR